MCPVYLLISYPVYNLSHFFPFVPPGPKGLSRKGGITLIRQPRKFRTASELHLVDCPHLSTQLVFKDRFALFRNDDGRSGLKPDPTGIAGLSAAIHTFLQL